MCSRSTATNCSLVVFTAFSHSLTRCMGAGMFGPAGWIEWVKRCWSEVFLCVFFTRCHAQTFLWKYHPYNRKTLPYYCSRQVYIPSPIQKIIRGKKQQRKGRMRCGGYEKCDAVVGYLLIGSTFPFPTRSALFSFFFCKFCNRFQWQRLVCLFFFVYVTSCASEWIS